MFDLLKMLKHHGYLQTLLVLWGSPLLYVTLFLALCVKYPLTHKMVAMTADSLLCGRWLGHGASHGLKFSTF